MGRLYIGQPETMRVNFYVCVLLHYEPVGNFLADGCAGMRKTFFHWSVNRLGDKGGCT